jgi:hypothetical protein
LSWEKDELASQDATVMPIRQYLQVVNQSSANRSKPRASKTVFNAAIYACGFLSAFAFRVSLNQPIVTPDGELYLRIANNLVLNGCYSDSPPLEAVCSPTWGSQPPGYPLFIALVKVLFGGTPQHIVAAQSFLYALTLAYLLFAVRLMLPGFKGWLFATGLLLAFSPLTAPWSHWVLTETLAAAASLWVAAECLRSLAIRQTRTPHIALALTAAVLVRWDLVWLILPAAVVTWHLHRARAMVYTVGLWLGVAAIPVLLLVARATALGLPPVPSALNATADELPPGVVSFWKAASTRQGATSTLLWAVWNRRYRMIETTFDYGSVSKKVGTDRLRSMLHALSSVPDGQPVPPEVDKSFAMIADDFALENPVYYRLVLPFERAVYLWGARDTLSHGGWRTDREQYLRLYRAALLGLVLIAPFLLSRNSSEKVFAWGVALFAISRTLFLVSLTSLEVRYVTPAIPLMELVVALLALKGLKTLRPPAPSGA